MGSKKKTKLLKRNGMSKKEERYFNYLKRQSKRALLAKMITDYRTQNDRHRAANGM